MAKFYKVCLSGHQTLFMIIDVELVICSFATKYERDDKIDFDLKRTLSLYNF